MQLCIHWRASYERRTWAVGSVIQLWNTAQILERCDSLSFLLAVAYGPSPDAFPSAYELKCGKKREVKSVRWRRAELHVLAGGHCRLLKRFICQRWQRDSILAVFLSISFCRKS
ncbi:Protein of unknown function [Pyronema omphalodes CBS 100304]|uniref:Uncharacterized protein n=1 Tax=Pyronema omphalodes (strain CBS 100304) TaxID=1076935 RepID=U4LMP0_PYROM|nr:Protein of unknown function [Pyronema omphalodes CBS 100304]